MLARAAKSLVIDASVAGGCGGPHATHPRAEACRGFLLDVLTICHRHVFTPEIRQEWDDHQTPSARQWRRAMAARQRKVAHPEVIADQAMCEKMLQTADTDTERDAMGKDIHLICAALATDGVVVSLDDTARDLFARAAGTAGEISDIVWVNPEETPAADLGEWLQAGAEPREEWTLGFPGAEEADDSDQ
jgi:hypothetical protein